MRMTILKQEFIAEGAKRRCVKHVKAMYEKRGQPFSALC